MLYTAGPRNQIMENTLEFFSMVSPAPSSTTTYSGITFIDPEGWRRGVVVIVVRRMNEVTLRRARLVLGWVTVFGRVYHHGT